MAIVKHVTRHNVDTLEPSARAPTRRTIRRVVARVLVGFGVLILIGVIVVFVTFRRDLGAARTRLTAIPTQVYASSYGDIEYRLVADGPTVLIAHGVNGGVDHGMRLTDQWQVLGGSNQYLYVSRFGYLRSSLPENASARLQAAAYRELLDHLGIDQVFLLGNSAGGPSSMWFAIDYPNRTKGLILHSSAVPGPVPGMMPKLLAEHDFLYWSAIKIAPGAVMGLLVPESIRATLTDTDKRFLMENAFDATMPISERTAGIIFDNEVSTPSVNEIPLERITVPTLIFQAIDDRDAEGGRLMARRIAGSIYVGLTGGHFLVHQESRLRTDTAAFIAQHQ